MQKKQNATNITRSNRKTPVQRALDYEVMVLNMFKINREET